MADWPIFHSGTADALSVEPDKVSCFFLDLSKLISRPMLLFAIESLL